MSLSLPVPLPYFHALNFLQNINYCFYCFALLSFESNLTPLILFVAILITTGMREVAVALSNPFGTDEVDFPINKWVVKLRSMALIVHGDNHPSIGPPVTPPDDTPPGAPASDKI